jgi:hypothetical protein
MFDVESRKIRWFEKPEDGKYYIALKPNSLSISNL